LNDLRIVGRLVSLRERGFLTRELGKWDKETVPLCSHLSSSQSTDPLTLQDVVTAFFAYAVGVAGSLALLLLENCFRFLVEREWGQIHNNEGTSLFY